MLAGLVGLGLLGAAVKFWSSDPGSGASCEELFADTLSRGERRYRFFRCKKRPDADVRIYVAGYVDDSKEIVPAATITVESLLNEDRDVYPKARVWTLAAADTRTGHTQLGLAKTLYTLALNDACADGTTLVSDKVRSGFTEALWRAQESRGRAECVPGEGVALAPYDENGLPAPTNVSQRAGKRTMRWGCKRYIAKCGAPLAGARRRR
jgi:hypothetical protein